MYRHHSSAAACRTIRTVSNKISPTQPQYLVTCTPTSRCQRLSSRCCSTSSSTPLLTALMRPSSTCTSRVLRSTWRRAAGVQTTFALACIIDRRGGQRSSEADRAVLMRSLSRSDCGHSVQNNVK